MKLWGTGVVGLGSGVWGSERAVQTGWMAHTIGTTHTPSWQPGIDGDVLPLHLGGFDGKEGLKE